MDGAMQDLNALGPRLQMDLPAGVGPRVVEGGCQPVLAGGQSVLVDTNLHSFSLVLVVACSF